MSTTIVNFFTSGQYEEIVKETSSFLRRVPANPTAVHLKSLAHYQLGEYDACIRLLERAIVYLVGREPLQMRLQLAGLLANAMLEQGRYEEVRDLVEHSVPEGSAVREEYGELLLASAWAAYFEGVFHVADQVTTRIFDISGEHFTCGRAALCAALAARRSGELHRGKAYLIKAHHHLGQAQNLFGNPAPVRGLFLLQAQIARRGSGEGLDAMMEETAHLPKGSKVASLLREAVMLYHGFLNKESVAAQVSAAVARGVKRPWMALLPGAQARARTDAEEPVEAERPVQLAAAPEPVEVEEAPSAAAPEFEPPPPPGEELPAPEEPVVEEAAPATEAPAEDEVVVLEEAEPEAAPAPEVPVLVEDEPVAAEPVAVAATVELPQFEELPAADTPGAIVEMPVLEVPPEDDAPLVIEPPVLTAALWDLEAMPAPEAAAEPAIEREAEPPPLPEVEEAPLQPASAGSPPLEEPPAATSAEEVEPSVEPPPLRAETAPAKPPTRVERVFESPAPAKVSEEPQPSSGSGVIRELHTLPNLQESPDLQEIFDPEGLATPAAPPAEPRPAPAKVPPSSPAARKPAAARVSVPAPTALPVSPPVSSTPRKPPTSVTLPAPKQPASAPLSKKSAPADEDIPIAQPVTRGGMSLVRGDPSADRTQRMQVRSRDEATSIRRKNAQGSILLVEPVERAAKALEDCLRDSNFRIAKRVDDIDAALEQYVLLRPSLVVVSLQAPGVAGAGAPGTPAFVRMFLELDPLCKIAVMFTAQTKPMVVEAVRQGARAGIEIPLVRPEVLDALGKALTARSPMEALRVPTLELKRPVACSWKAVEGGVRGFLGAWQSFVARSLDPMGLEANLPSALKVGAMIRLNIEVPGAEKPVQTLAEVTSTKREPALNHHVTRFTFVKLPSEARDRLVGFLMDAMSRTPKGK